VTWTFTVPQGGRGGQQTFCALTLGNQRIAGPSPCTTSATYDLTGRPYGTYTFTVSDGFRNGSTATSTYTLVPPPPPTAPTITSAPTSPARSTSPTWSFTVPAGTTAQCSLLNGSTTVSAPATCTSPKSYPLTTDGTYTFRVVAIDNLGQASSPATSAYTLDTTPPATPVITGSPSSPNDAGPTWTFTAAGTTSTCTLTAGGVAVGGPAPCTGSATYDLTTKPAGPYVFSVTTADGLGNTSPAATSTYTYAGLPAPPAPTITSSPTSPGRNTQPTWTFTTKAGTVTTCTVSKGGTTVIAATPCTASFTPNLGPFGDGAYTLSVIAFDGASGLSSAPATRTYTLDTTPPAPPPFTATPAPTSNSATPVWRFSTPAGATSLQCTLTRGGTVISGPSPCTGGSFNPNLRTSGDGTYTLTVVAIDAAGNTSAPSTSSYTYDTTPPPAPAITSAPPSLSNISAPTWTFTTPAGAATQCTLAQGATVISGPGPCSGSFSDPLTGRPDGTYTFTVWAVDGAGNASPTVVSSIVRDTTPPGPPTILTGPAKTTSASSANWTFKAPGSASTQCSITKGTTTAVAVGPVSCGSPSAFDLSTLPSGPYTFNVVAYDAAGNASAPATYPFTWQAPAPPAPAPSPSGSTGSPGSGPRTVTLAPVPITPAPSTITIIAPPAPSLPAPARSTGSNSAGNGAKAKPGAPKATTPGAAGTAEAPATPTTAAPAPVEQIIQTAGKVAGAVSKKAAFPLLLILLMIFFLAIQDQIDRRDPKLADAPVHPTNDLGFDPPPTRRPA
jgi:predicted phage tail protein